VPLRLTAAAPPVTLVMIEPAAVDASSLYTEPD
jgi:hypothetical protein